MAPSPSPPLALDANPKPKTRKRYTTTGASLKRMVALGLVAKIPTTKRSQRGWGPYHSVVRERSVEFNLTLDLQHMRQEIDELRMARDLLQSRAVLQRHDPAGPLAQTMKAYYDVFRQGFITPDRDADTAAHQQAFLRNILDEGIDVGNGLTGIDVMLGQGRSYAQLLRVLSLQMDQLHIVDADDSVVIYSKGRFRFQIQPQTILGIFPHVAGNQRILSKLIGREAEVATSMAFYFDVNNKVIKCDADMDFVNTFMTLLQDPQDVAELLGQALIADNCMIGIEGASDSGPSIEILSESELVDVSFPQDLVASTSDIGSAKTTGSSSMDKSLQPRVTTQEHPPQAANDSTSNAMSMAFILG